MGFAVGSQVERGFSWERNGPLKARVMALRLKAHTADAAILLLHGEMEMRRQTLKMGQQGADIGKDGQRESKRAIFNYNTCNSDVMKLFPSLNRSYGLLKAKLCYQHCE